MVTTNRKDFLFRFSMLTLLFFSFPYHIFTQEASTAKRDLYFYGSVIESGDTSRVQMSSDLFYSQLQIDDTFVLHDRRSVTFTVDILEQEQESGNLLFYHEIREEDEKWFSSLHLIDLSTKEEVSVKYVYDDYYRVLIDAKDSLTELLKKYTSGAAQTFDFENTPSSESISIINLFGTWQGEEYVDKIVLLRGGRGFVIFENGASMNISVNIQGATFIATQESKSNASFYPNLPREVALVKALDGVPIEWELTIENENSLVGVKHTYTSEEVDGLSSVIKAEIPVKWYR